jgi:nucleotide-binding universal stress UspA family protein
LVAVDGSTEAEKALDYAITLTKATGASLGLIHVVQLPHVYSSEWRIPTPVSYNTVEDENQAYRKVIEMSEANGKAMLEMAKAKVKAAGVIADAIMQSGHPAHCIVKVASEKGYDLIVLGSRGNSAIREALLGSVSHHVTQHSKCSVLIVR